MKKCYTRPSTKNIKSVAAGLYLAIAAMALTATSAHAILIEQDLVASSGDNFITFDSDTGLEWLDVNLTIGQSYNTSEASTFVTVDGFRHATLAEVLALWINSGRVAAPSTAFSTANFVPSVDFVAKFGCTGSCALSSAFVQGIYETSPTTVASGLVQQETAGPIGRYFEGFGSFSLTSASGDTGNFLVRESAAEALPEPTTLAIVAIGLAGMGFARRKRAA